MSKMKTSLLQGESLIDMQNCSRLGKAGMVWGGTIFVTNQRIIFETNGANSMIKEVTDIIDVNDVLEYAYADHLVLGWMIPIPGVSQNKSVSIRTSKGDYRFTPTKTNKLMESLRQVCPNAVLGEKSSYTEAMKETIFGNKNSNVSEKKETSVNSVKEMSGNFNGRMQGFEASPVAPPSQPGPALDVVAEIKKYKELLDMGAITEEEFQAKKKQLLN